ncbi:hemolysin family protein [Pasteuria penetrans]|uniref:hemolysin family protein n=1 Tax=Pasteuria penetrans TaxID=86005 RepID=UPI001FE2DFB3|nr:hemolysin family protein [Pasteuria penetrans]
MDGPLYWDNVGALIIKLLLAVFLVALNGFFVAAEFAIVKARPTRVKQLSSSGSVGKMAQTVLSSLDTYLSVTQVGITLASLGLGWAAKDTMGELLVSLFKGFGLPAWFPHVVAVSLAFLLVTVGHIVFGEMAPKSIAIYKAEEITLWVARPLHFFYRLFRPFIFLLEKSANLVLRLLRVDLKNLKHNAHTEEEIRMLLAQSHKSGVIDQAELMLFDNIFEFADRIAREVMVPRVNMVCLFVDKTFEDNFEIIKNARHTRFPLCGRDKDDIRGIVHIRHVYECISSGVSSPVLMDLARPNVVVPETMELKDILRNLQKNRVEMAIVVDEFGGTSGLVTTEDIIEEIFGEIQDEFDDEKPLFQIGSEGTLIAARLLIEEVNDHFQTKIEDTDNDTIGGWLFSRLEKVPEVGDEIRSGAWVFVVQEVDQLRIKRILVKPMKLGNDGETEVSTGVDGRSRGSGGP